MPESVELSLGSLRAAYLAGTLTPAELLEQIREAADAQADNPIWIYRLNREEQQVYLAGLEGRDPAELPLYGVPFAIKDNIDLAGVPTTAACPEYAYLPERSAHVVQCLLDAGAIPVGKTNMDQFATGLVGTRSPYGAVRNAFDPEYVSGGSSSGSAVAVAKGLASFSLGTDTAGSGRVPAAFNNLVGIKPSPGLLSTSGVVPACRSLDCVSVFALTVEDAQQVMQVAVDFDAEDAYARTAPTAAAIARPTFSFAIPEQLEFFGDADAERLFQHAVDQLQSIGGQAEAIDFSAYTEAARLLYEGPWVAERYAAIEQFIQHSAEVMDPTVRGIVESGSDISAVDSFKSQYRLQALRRRVAAGLAQFDFMLTPTTATIYRVEEVQADPVILNSRLGHYTNFMNLLDCAAVAVSAGFSAAGLPYGITLFGPAFSDLALAGYAHRLQQKLQLSPGATGMPLPASEPELAPAVAAGYTRLVVCGAHMQGLPLNHQLSERGGHLLQRTTTSDRYRLYALPGDPPLRPGLVRQRSDGSAIEVEVWQLRTDRLGDFLAGIPAPLGLGQVELADGGWEIGFICEGYGVENAEDITALGGWRQFQSRSG